MYVSETDKTSIARGPKPHFHIELPAAGLEKAFSAAAIEREPHVFLRPALGFLDQACSTLLDFYLGYCV